MRRLFSRRNLLVVCLILLALFVVRPQAARLRWRITQSISAELGRRVEIGSVHLRFLPRPGFELENLVIHDNDAFGAEPFLRSPDVTASLRIMAILRGRIEISSLSLSEASLNLTRDPQGQWNLNDLIQRNASIMTAPTSAANRQSRPEFPYIEASRSRINFKIGNEKTHFAFTDAEIALWQESENAWGVRLAAKPIRTDANLSDTGLLSVTGLWQRSPVLHETPLQFSFEWKQAQIGQVSKLVFGGDKGWRGGILVSGALVGTPRKLRVSARASIDNFGRYDVFGGSDLRLTANCTAQYGSFARNFSDVKCSGPVGDGRVELTGDVSGPPSSPSYAVSLSANEVPAQAVVTFLRNVSGRVPKEFTATGNLNGTLVAHHLDPNQPAELQGQGEIRELEVVSGNAPIVVGTVPISVASALRSFKPRNKGGVPAVTRLELGPAAVTLGRPSPLQIRASFSALGYEASIRGDAGIKRLLQTASSLGIPAPAVSADGSSTVDLTIANDWADTQRSIVTGTAKLRAVRARVRGLNAPLQIEGADLLLTDQSVRVRNLNASAADATWRGTLDIPRPCAAPDSCNFQFNVHTPQVSATTLNQLLNPQAGNKWYRFLPGTSEKPYLLTATASGKIAIDRLVLGGTTCNHFSTDLALHHGKVSLSNVVGDLLGGKATAELAADFSSHPPAYSGTATVEGWSFAQISSLMHSAWIDGSGSARLQFKAAGAGMRDLIENADLTADFNIKNGVFPHIILTGTSSPLHATAFSGRLALHGGDFSFEDTKLESENSVYKLSGRASLDGALHLQMLSETSASFNLSGSVAKTRVSPIINSSTQASLKP